MKKSLSFFKQKYCTTQKAFQRKFTEPKRGEVLGATTHASTSSLFLKSIRKRDTNATCNVHIASLDPSLSPLPQYLCHVQLGWLGSVSGSELGWEWTVERQKQPQGMPREHYNRYVCATWVRACSEF